MPKVLIIHGISNQYLGENQLRSRWYEALCDGLKRADSKISLGKEDVYCPFYGDLFRKDGMLSQSAPVDSDLTGIEAQLLEAVWRAAAASDTKVPSPEDFAETLIWAPRIVERALTSLARSTFLADYIPLQFLGDLKQVAAYITVGNLRQTILDRVRPHITSETRVVIGHSLGSVVAYEALYENPSDVRMFLSVGSPLGIRNVVFDRLTPPPSALGIGSWPGQMQWTNVAAKGDIVAAQKALAPLFGNKVRDEIIDSDLDAHSAERYLNSRAAGLAIAAGLA